METNRSSHVCNQRHKPSQRVQTFLLCLLPTEGPLEATHISSASHVEEQQQNSSVTAVTAELCAYPLPSAVTAQVVFLSRIHLHI